MSLVLDGTNGLSDVDGSAATPAIRGTDANTGIFFPAADTIAFAEGGAEVMRIDSSGHVGIGTSSPATKLDVRGTIGGINGYSDGLILQNATSGSVNRFLLGQSLTSGAYIYTDAPAGVASPLPLTFWTTGTERARIDSSGKFLVGLTTAYSDGAIGTPVLQWVAKSGNFVGAICSADTTSNLGAIAFKNPNGVVGQISTSGSATSYATSSDYRLKNTIAPMTGALAKIALLKPCTYKWNADGSDGEGFIAHELQAVVPECVTGEKDAVDAEGNPQYQGIDTSFLVATLTAAIQELKAIVDAQGAEIAALKGTQP